MERQAHGFQFEQTVSQLFDIELNNEYTGLWDGKKNNIPVSIKHIKKGYAIDLGDIFRQASILEEFYMVIGFYDDKCSDQIYILHFQQNEWHNYFMDLKAFQPFFKNALDSVSNSYEDDEKWKKLLIDCKQLWKENTPNIVRPNGKRDHKKQKRWQCSISNTLFYKEILPKYEISKESFMI